ncbi:MAG: hypothetical protein ACR2JY_17380 [Chloroflexota bacterium]
MMGLGYGGVSTAWLLWSALVVLLLAAMALLVIWAMHGNGDSDVRRLPE